MDIKTMNMEQVLERRNAIKEELNHELSIEQIEALETEVNELNERKKYIEDAIEKRKALETELINATNLPILESRTIGEERMELDMNKEYRSAWLKNLQGIALNEVEQRAFTGSAAVVPEQTADMIIDKLVDAVPLLNEVELLRFKGNASFAVQSVAPAPTLKAGGSAVDEATTTLVEVTLGSYTMSALVRIGADVASMAINAFEGWLTDKLVEQLAYKIEYYIIKGSGESQPKGVDAITYTDGTNAVDWASSALAVADIDEAIGLLPAAYDRNSKFLMSKKTFYTNVSGLTDTNNFPVIERVGNGFMLRGYPVLFSDQVDAGDIFFGDFKRGMVANLSNDLQVEKGRNLAYNAYDYLGWASFDCKPSGINCIVKIASDIA